MVQLVENHKDLTMIDYYEVFENWKNKAPNEIKKLKDKFEFAGDKLSVRKVIHAMSLEQTYYGTMCAASSSVEYIDEFEIDENDVIKSDNEFNHNEAIEKISENFEVPGNLRMTPLTNERLANLKEYGYSLDENDCLYYATDFSDEKGFSYNHVTGEIQEIPVADIWSASVDRDIVIDMLTDEQWDAAYNLRSLILTNEDYAKHMQKYF